MGKGTLLVVDDDPAVGTVVSLRLKLAGYESISARDGESAIRAALERSPDAIILDRQLGDEDGLSILSALQQLENTRHIPVLLVSGEPLHGDEVKRARAAAFLAKPFF